MTKVVSVIFPNSHNEYKVEYFEKDKNSIKSILDYAQIHNCKVVLLHGFTEEEVEFLQGIEGIIIQQK